MALPTWASVIIALAAALLVAVSAESIFNRFVRKPFKPTGKHCFITGGSTGLGKALAIELVKKGANVTIVARRQSELDKAAKEIEANKVDDNQRVVTVSADMTCNADVTRAFEEAKIKMDGDPEIVCACAGAAYPKLFVDHTVEDFEYMSKLNYLGQVYVAHQATLRMREAGIKDGKIVFVSSMAGLIGLAGYAAYSPTKFALRGLADSLRNELKMYDIDVHIYLPGNIDTPGFATENLTKPKVTRIIEGLSVPVSPVDCAKSLIKGLEAGRYMITNEFIAEVLRSATRGVNPSNSFILDTLMAIVGQPVGSIYALYMDHVVKHTK
ncbi:NAD(P)-binding protein [Lichtheimia hyalospora FSU 10163]|nr:NAD(P)-binding protein [Lichtheimia hyalospora FSU 10163]